MNAMQPTEIYDSPAPVPTKNSPDTSRANIGFVAGDRPHFSEETTALLRSRLSAAALVVACNVLRIAASIWVGLRWGSSDLVLFHNWVGTLFALAYTLIGFLFMLYLMLPKEGESAYAREVAR